MHGIGVSQNLSDTAEMNETLDTLTNNEKIKRAVTESEPLRLPK